MRSAIARRRVFLPQRNNGCHAMRKRLLQLLAIALPFVLVTYFFMVEFSTYALVLSKAVLGCFLLYFIIKYAHDEIDAIYMYREYPLTYAAMLVAYALVIAASLIGS